MKSNIQGGEIVQQYIENSYLYTLIRTPLHEIPGQASLSTIPTISDFSKELNALEFKYKITRTHAYSRFNCVDWHQSVFVVYEQEKYLVVGVATVLIELAGRSGANHFAPTLEKNKAQFETQRDTRFPHLTRIKVESFPQMTVLLKTLKPFLRHYLPHSFS